VRVIAGAEPAATTFNTAVDDVDRPLASVAVAVYVVEAVGVTVACPVMGNVPVATAGEIVNDAAFVTCHVSVAGCPAIIFAGVTLKAITADEGPVFDPPPEPPPGPEAPTPPQPKRANNKETREIWSNLTNNLGRFMARFTYLGTGCDVKAAAQVAGESSC
jgi:hypothetical protein